MPRCQADGTGICLARTTAPGSRSGTCSFRVRPRAWHGSHPHKRTAMPSLTAPGELLTLTVTAGVEVSGRWLAPADTRACYVLAHGAGAGMEHPFMRAVALELADRGVATLRYQFPYMERRARRPD